VIGANLFALLRNCHILIKSAFELSADRNYLPSLEQEIAYNRKRLALSKGKYHVPLTSQKLA